jgi:N-acetylglutamate synthase-like GNAT family acetyltransferase
MTGHIRVRVASLDDIDAVDEILQLSYPILMAPGYTKEVLARALPLMVRANPALLRSGTFYLAEQAPDGAVAGCGGWTFERPGESGAPIDPTVAHIRHFATHPDWIRRGVGRALLDRCIAEARAAGVHRLECYSSLVAEPFYAALGFTFVERLMVEMGPGITLPSVRMFCGLTECS